MKEIKIAIIDGNKDELNTFISYLRQYERKREDIVFNISSFSSSIKFLDPYTGDYDAVFMDINIPYINGFETSTLLRKVDSDVLIIYVTNLIQYALKGYEYNATDFIPKNLEKLALFKKLDSIIDKISNKKQVSYILLPTGSGFAKVPLLDIYYVETSGHKVVYHTQMGDFVEHVFLKEVEKKLPNKYFSRCNSSYLVNLLYVKEINGYNVNVKGNNLDISHPRKKDFVKSFIDFENNKNQMFVSYL